MKSVPGGSFLFGGFAFGRLPVGELVTHREVGTKHQRSIESLALLALEALDNPGSAFGQEFGKLLVRQFLAALVAEEGKAAVHIGALDDLREEQHPAVPAFGTRVFALRRRYGHFGFQQFGHNLCGICLDVAPEGGSVGLARFDACQRVLPRGGHFHVGNLLVLHRFIDRHAFVGGHEAFLLPLDITACEQRFDDGSTGGRGSDARLADARP